MHPSDLLLRFVGSTGNSREARFYLRLFRSERPEAFAIVAASNEVLTEATDAIVADLRFLARLGLRPVLWLGGHPSASPASQAQTVRAHRARIAKRLASEVTCAELDCPHEAARPGSGPSPGHHAGLGAGAGAGTQASTGQKADSDQPDANHALAAAVTRAARAGALPMVIAPEPENHNPATALGALAAALGTRKVIFLDLQSGLAPNPGPVPSLVDVPRESQALGPLLAPEQAALLDVIETLIAHMPPAFTVAVTSPLTLLRELFTQRGAGTLLRRGAVVTRHNGYAALDTGALRHLLETAFERPLRADFFDRPVAALYLAEPCRGLAVILNTPHGYYLSKFAVERQAQGEGVGRDLWRVLAQAHRPLIWRSRVGNPINGWYQQRCDGMMRRDTWQVFWRGLNIDDVPAAIRYIEAAPADFPLPSAGRLQTQQ